MCKLFIVGVGRPRASGPAKPFSPQQRLRVMLRNDQASPPDITDYHYHHIQPGVAGRLRPAGLYPGRFAKRRDRAHYIRSNDLVLQGDDP
jgi:hypothetical protein